MALAVDLPRHCFTSVAEAYRAALAAAQGQDEIIVLGSFYTVPETMAEELNCSGN